MRNRQMHADTCPEAPIIESKRQRKEIVCDVRDASGLSHGDALPRETARSAASCPLPHRPRKSPYYKILYPIKKWGSDVATMIKVGIGADLSGTGD